ncbi:MAG: TIM barrel protein [Candidatus Jacksonbacteria bacterium]
MTESKKKFFSWLKQHLLLNLGFAPKLFGYKDEDLYRLTQGSLKKYTNGVEYYFGLNLRGVEQAVDDFPKKLVQHKLIKIMHAPFVREPYPYKKFGKITLSQWMRDKALTRASANSWHRLPKAIKLSSAIGAEKINIHAIDLILAPQSDKLFHELDKLSANQNIIICLENNARTPKKQLKDKSEWQAAHDPIKLMEYLRQNNLENFYITIDTAHLAAAGCNVAQKWEKIKQFTHGDINTFISHFHLVDFKTKGELEAEVPGKGEIGLEVFQKIITDLYQMDYQGTISLELAPLYFYRQRYKLVANSLKRYIWPFKDSLREEEEYILGAIQAISNF